MTSPGTAVARIRRRSDAELAASERAARRALELDPRNPSAHVALGSVLRDRFEWEASEQAYRAALAIDPDNAEAHQQLGELLFSTGRVGRGRAGDRPGGGVRSGAHPTLHTRGRPAARRPGGRGHRGLRAGHPAGSREPPVGAAPQPGQASISLRAATKKRAATSATIPTARRRAAKLQKVESWSAGRSPPFPTRRDGSWARTMDAARGTGQRGRGAGRQFPAERARDHVQLHRVVSRVRSISVPARTSGPRCASTAWRT